MAYVNASKLSDLNALLECQDAIASAALQARDDEKYYIKTKTRLESVIARAEKQLAELNHRREHASAIVEECTSRKRQLKQLVKKEEHKIQIERFLRLQKELAEMQEEESDDDVQ